MKYRHADGAVSVFDGDGVLLVSVPCKPDDAAALIAQAKADGWQSIVPAEKPKKAKK